MTAEKKYRNPALNHDSFLEAGYKYYKNRGATLYADAFWQKKFIDEKGIKYYIECYEYDWSNREDHLYRDVMYEPQAYLKLPDDEVIRLCITVNSNADIEHIEKLVEKAFTNMGCIYHELYEN